MATTQTESIFTSRNGDSICWATEATQCDFLWRQNIKEMHTKFWSESLERQDCLEDLGVEGKIILKWTS